MLIYLHVCRLNVFAVCQILAGHNSAYTCLLKLVPPLKGVIFTLLILGRKESSRRQSGWWFFAFLI